MEETKYLYTIQHPRRPIKGLSKCPILRVSKTLPLTKDDVLKSIKLATVWRRFSADNLVRVTPDTVDRLHNGKFMTEEEYKKFLLDQKGINHSTVTVDNKQKDSIVNDKATAKEETEVSATLTDDASTKDTVTLTDVNPSEEIPEDKVEATVADKDSDVKDQKVSGPIRPINADHQNNQYNGRKGKNNNKK